MKKPKTLSELSNPLRGATFYAGDKKISEKRFWKNVVNELHPPKKRVIKKERKFTLKEMIDCWEACVEEIRTTLAKSYCNKCRKEYFKDTFGIDIK